MLTDPSTAACRLVTRLLDLWAAPIPDPADALVRFSTVYTDPVTLNGTALPLTALVERAAATHVALERTGVEVLEVVAQDDKVVVAFAMTARHIGTWPSTLGGVPPTGCTVTVRTIDVLTLTGGLVSGIWVVSDEAGMLSQLGASLRR
ncbi:ester cyclase [Actinoplanes sp. NPDC051633]|uniref:ester cyclase n=1 Tax=Actinoplanes sp. NPDC051633 TaxID=3155670 RepID=UPI00343B98FB